METGENANPRRRFLGYAFRLLCSVAPICAITAGSLTAAAPATAAEGGPLQGVKAQHWMPPHAEAPHEVRAPSGGAIVTESGPLKGIETATTDEFLGIPYAAPPLGALRWIPPVPHGRWHGLFQATQFGNFCTQPNGLGGTFGSEDCLSLNVYTPREKKNQNKHHGLPVMVWIHGGGLVTGGSAIYDPTPLVEQGDVIVVTINYRLGFLGFFAHPALDAEGHLSGNYGLMDQQFALKWVQRNIEAFGGDPNRVTIFGESAGGHSVYCNLASPMAAGLFAGAIAESGSYSSFAPYLQSIVSLAIGETTGGPGVPAGTSVAASVGCSSQTAQCLRATPAASLVGVQPGTLYAFVDGTLLTQTPGEAFANGQFNRVPVISGTNHDEWRIFVAGQYGSSLVTEADYEAAVVALWGPVLGPFIYTTFYPLINYPIIPPIPGDPSPSPGIALGASGTDGIFSCPARNADQSLAQHVPTYTYEFNDENAPGFPGANFPLGAYHFSEVQYLFDVFGVASSTLFTPDQRALSKTMIGYWTEFAKTGNPNFAGAPLWSLYSTASDDFQSLVPPLPVVEFNFATDHQCTNLWEFIP